MSRYSFRKPKNQPENNVNYDSRKLYDIINYLDNHYTENINIDEFIKDKTNISHSWFIKKFRAATGTTPLEYINNLRINNAKSLLENTDYNISEIASLVGYNDALYFSRYFKKKTGISPLKYKRTCT